MTASVVGEKNGNAVGSRPPALRVAAVTRVTTGPPAPAFAAPAQNEACRRRVRRATEHRGSHGSAAAANARGAAPPAGVRRHRRGLDREIQQMADVADSVTTLEKTVDELRRRAGVPPYDPRTRARSARWSRRPPARISAAARDALTVRRRRSPGPPRAPLRVAITLRSLATPVVAHKLEDARAGDRSRWAFSENIATRRADAPSRKAILGGADLSCSRVVRETLSGHRILRPVSRRRAGRVRSVACHSPSRVSARGLIQRREMSILTAPAVPAAAAWTITDR